MTKKEEEIATAARTQFANKLVDMINKHISDYTKGKEIAIRNREYSKLERFDFKIQALQIVDSAIEELLEDYGDI